MQFININKKMNQEQGFAHDSATELVQFNYVPLSNIKPYIPKVYINPLKWVAIPHIHESSLFINPKLKQILQKQFKKKHQSNIVYNSSCKEEQTIDTISFDSNFQGGNLQYVVSYDRKNFQLYIKPDTNTKTHFQWFWFKVKNKNAQKIHFTIKNFMKKHMLYRQGLRPYYKSMRGEYSSYRQIQEDVTYKESEVEDGKIFYQLSFEFHFRNSPDEIQFCSQPPYTLARFQKMFQFQNFRRINISKTVLGHHIDAFLFNEQKNYKAVVVAFARQHPGQNVGSWIMEGFLNTLANVNNSQICWIIVPLINIDGVTLGNNRTGLLGFDFNRHWYIEEDNSKTHLFPQITGIIRYLKNRKKQFGKKIKIFLDFHGHSSQQNVFSYGPPHQKSSEYYYLGRLFPFLIQKQNPDFSLRQCTYQISSQKRHCSRSLFFQRLGFQFSYTIQSSFGIYQGRRITETDMLRMGQSVCQATVQFIQLQIGNDNKKDGLQKIINVMKNQILESPRSPCDDSDSEEEDSSSPIRIDFQNKIVSILTDKPLPEIIDKPNRNSSGKKKQLEISKIQIGKIKNIRSQNYKRRGLTLHQRVRTEEIRQIKTPVERQKSLVLPRLMLNNRYQKQEVEQRQAKLEGNLNLQNLSLAEIKIRLKILKNSKLGRKILILNNTNI